MIKEFLTQYGMTIMYALLTAAAGAAGTWIGRIYKKYIDDKTKQSVVTTCCRAVEQIYKDLKGQEKYDKAVEAITEMLSVKGITITDIEVRMLIEAACREFSGKAKEEARA